MPIEGCFMLGWMRLAPRFSFCVASVFVRGQPNRFGRGRIFLSVVYAKHLASCLRSRYRSSMLFPMYV